MFLLHIKNFLFYFVNINYRKVEKLKAKSMRTNNNWTSYIPFFVIPIGVLTILLDGNKYRRSIFWRPEMIVRPDGHALSI